KKLVYFFYTTLTKQLNKQHYNVIFNKSAILHQRFSKVWEGDSITLKADMIRAM
ncbi:hypothetical protein V8F44DRAFT_470368, partial [Aspergillus fumigatus]